MKTISRWGTVGALAVAAAAAQDAREIAERARELARQGFTARAVVLYRQALGAAPAAEEMALRRDYAVTLGWAERYEEARREFRRVLELEPEQPAWAQREMARTELFGGNPGGALVWLDRLIQDGDRSEATLVRRGLALRWSSRPAEAECVYQELLKREPGSVEARVGLALALADQDRLERALKVLEGAPEPDRRLLQAKGQVLNGMGRHLEARRIFDQLWTEHAGDPEIVEGRALAARWGGDPTAAREAAAVLVRSFPGRSSGVRLYRELSLEYGYAAATTARFIEDSDGLLDQTWSQEFALHAGPAHQFRFTGQYRRFSQDEALGWRRYETGWSGVLGRRLSAAASLAGVDYLQGEPSRRLTGEGSLVFQLNDRARVSGGAGSLAMDAYRSVQDRVTASFRYLNLSLRPRRKLALEGQYSHYRFSDGVGRERLDLSGFRQVRTSRRLRLEAGGRSNLLWHDQETGHFFSPDFFQSHLGVARASGRLSDRLEYRAELGAGVQREPGVAAESPLVFSGLLTWRFHPNLRLEAEGGRSTSSVERVNPGRSSYSRRFAVVSLLARWD